MSGIKLRKKMVDFDLPPVYDFLLLFIQTYLVVIVNLLFIALNTDLVATN